MEIYKQYKFVVAIENSFSVGYWSEKMINAVLAQSIPIYAGLQPTPWVNRYVNPDRFIYCPFDKAAFSSAFFDEQVPNARVQYTLQHQADALKACVEKVKVVDQDDDLYQAIINTPFLPNNTLEGSVFDLSAVAGDIRRILRDHNSYLTEDD